MIEDLVNLWDNFFGRDIGFLCSVEQLVPQVNRLPWRVASGGG